MPIFGLEILLAKAAYALSKSASADSTDKSASDAKDSSKKDSTKTSSNKDSFGKPPPSGPDNASFRVPTVLSNPSSKSEAEEISDNDAWRYMWDGINNLFFPYSDITPENAVEKGRSYYESGDYEKASVAYSIRIDAQSRDSKARRLRMESNQKVLQGLKQREETDGISSDERDYLQKRQLQISQQIYADQAMYWAVEAKKEKKSLGDIKKVFEQLHDAPTEEKQEVVGAVEGMGHQYLVLGSQEYPDKEDTEFVRKQLSGLAADTYEILSHFSSNDKTKEISQRAPIYDGYKSLAQGNIDDALVKFKKIRDAGKDAPGFEEANEIVSNIENNQLRRINLYALEAWKAYIHEGEAVESREANGWVAQTYLFYEMASGKDETIEDRVAKRWGLERDLHNVVVERILSGEQNTIQEALKDIEKNGPAEFSDRARKILAEQHTNTNDSGYVLPHLVAYASELNPSALAGRALLDEGAMLDSQYFAISTPAAIYSLVGETTKDSTVKADAKAYMASLEKEKGLGDVVVSLYRSESLEMMALDIVTFKAAGTVGTKATIRALEGLGKAGVVGRRGVILAEAAGVTSEASILWGIGEVREGAFQDVNQVYTAGHMSQNYGADLIMIGLLKGLAPRIGALSARAARGLGMVKNGGLELTGAGKVLAWAGGHTGGIGAMFTASQASHYLGLRQAASEDWKAGLAIDVYTYVKYAVAQKAISGKGVSKEHAEHAKLASLKAAMLAEGAVKRLGYTPKSRTPEGDPIYADPAAQSLYLKLTMYSIQIPDFNSNKLTDLLKRGRIKEAKQYAGRFGLVLDADGVREMNYHETLAGEETKAANESQSPPDTVPEVDPPTVKRPGPGEPYASPDTTGVMGHEGWVRVDGMQPVNSPADLPSKIQALGKFIKDNPNTPGVDQVARLYNEAKVQYDALDKSGALNNPNTDTKYRLFDIDRLLNQAIKIQQAARPAGGGVGDTVVMSNPDVGNTIVMDEPASAPKSSRSAPDTEVPSTERDSLGAAPTERRAANGSRPAAEAELPELSDVNKFLDMYKESTRKAIKGEMGRSNDSERAAAEGFLNGLGALERLVGEYKALRKIAGEKPNKTQQRNLDRMLKEASDKVDQLKQSDYYQTKLNEPTLASAQDVIPPRPQEPVNVGFIPPSELRNDPNHKPLPRGHSLNQSFDESVLQEFLGGFNEGTPARNKLDSIARGNGELKDAADIFLRDLGTLKDYVEQYNDARRLSDEAPEDFGRQQLARKKLGQALSKMQQVREYYERNFSPAESGNEQSSVPIPLQNPRQSVPVSDRVPESSVTRDVPAEAMRAAAADASSESRPTNSSKMYVDELEINSFLGNQESETFLDAFTRDKNWRPLAEQYRLGLQALRARADAYEKMYHELIKDPSNLSLKQSMQEHLKETYEKMEALKQSPFYKMDTAYRVWNNESLVAELGPLADAFVHCDITKKSASVYRLRVDRQKLATRLASNYGPEVLENIPLDVFENALRDLNRDPRRDPDGYQPTALFERVPVRGFKNIPIQEFVTIDVKVTSQEQVQELISEMQSKGIKVVRNDVSDHATELTVTLPLPKTRGSGGAPATDRAWQPNQVRTGGVLKFTVQVEVPAESVEAAPNAQEAG
ncbi:MAG: hypothetical protein ABH871_00270 [Pseudomonadota bacterium]